MRLPPGTPAGLLIVAAGLLAAGCAAAPERLDVQQAELVVCAQQNALSGIDVSHWQGTINWDAVKGAGAQYAFIRVSDGLNTQDTQWARNWAEAKRVGVKRGAYQFFRPQQDPNAQADLFLQKLGALEPGDLPAVLDVEDDDGASPAQMVTNMKIWLDRVETATGKRPIIYTGLYFWRDHVGSNDFLSYPLWIAQYGRQCPDIPGPWTTWTFWQTSSTGRIAGISGDVDTNLFQGDMAALEAFAGGMPECGDGVCNGDETAGTCAGDCPICAPVPSDEARTIDDGDECHVLGGDLQYWRKEDGMGEGGSLRWTYTVVNETPLNSCTWELGFNAAGRYRVEVSLTQPVAQSVQAAYEVGHAGEVTSHVVNQSMEDGWYSLGEFEFAQGGDQYVLLGDNTGEARELERKLVCDALRVTPLDVDVEMPDGGPGPFGDPPRKGAGLAGSSCAVNPGRAPGSGTGATLVLCVGLLLATRRPRR